MSEWTQSLATRRQDQGNSINDQKILVELQFDRDKFEEVLRLCLALPEALAPNRWAWGETGKTTPILNVETFVNEMKKQKLGPYMRGKPGVEHAISKGGINTNGERYPLKITSWLRLKPEDIRSFVIHMSQAKPFFGFASTWEEYERRNRIIVQVKEVMRIETWAGRDPRRYLPGLYWLTLISDDMARMSGIDTRMIANIAESSQKLASSAYLYQFYPRPEYWMSTDLIENTLDNLPGVFDIQKVRLLAKRSRSEAEILELTRQWP